MQDGEKIIAPQVTRPGRRPEVRYANFVQIGHNAAEFNPYKVKAYRRAAARLRMFSESLDELVREEADLTAFTGIGDAIDVHP